MARISIIETDGEKWRVKDKCEVSTSIIFYPTSFTNDAIMGKQSAVVPVGTLSYPNSLARMRKRMVRNGG